MLALWITIIVFNGITSVGFLGAFLTTFFLSNYDELGDFPEVLCEDQSICLWDRPAAYAMIQSGLALFSGVMFGIMFATKPTREYRGWFQCHGIFHVLLGFGAAIFLMFRLVNMGMLNFAWMNQGCKNPNVEGSPFERLLRYGLQNISDIDHCKFNAFNQEAIIYSSSTVATVGKLDWSNKTTYMEVQRPDMLEKANAALNGSGTAFNNLTLPYYYEYYYWGCNNVCLPDRAMWNVLWVWMSLGATLLELLLAMLSFYLSTGVIQEPLPTCEQELTPLIQKELPEGIIIANVEKVDENQTDSSNNGANSSPLPSDDDDEEEDEVYTLRLRL